MVLTEIPAPRPPRNAEERDALLAGLEGRESWPHAAASLLAELGFRLVGPEGSGREHWHLLVALRDRPTLRHFDPELVGYYAATATGAELVQHGDE